MQIDLSTKILDLQGNPIPDGTGDFTVGAAAAAAAIGTFQGEDLSATDKVRRFKLALICTAGGVVDMDAATVAQMRDLVGKAYPPLVVGRVFDILLAAEGGTS